MKNLLQLLLFPFSLLGFAQSSVQDIDCAVLKDALYAESNNTSHNFLAENNGSMLRFKDAVFYSNRQFFPQTKIQLNIPHGHLNITSYVDDLSATTPSDYLDAFQWQIYSCFENKNINAGLIAREDGKDFIFVFADTESQYHPEIRTKGLQKIMNFIESGLSQRGIKVVSKYQDGENILLETPETQLVLRYTHDLYDIHTANIILTLRKISRN